MMEVLLRDGLWISGNLLGWFMKRRNCAWWFLFCVMSYEHSSNSPIYPEGGGDIN